MAPEWLEEQRRKTRGALLDHGSRARASAEPKGGPRLDPDIVHPRLFDLMIDRTFGVIYLFYDRDSSGRPIIMDHREYQEFFKPFVLKNDGYQL